MGLSPDGKTLLINDLGGFYLRGVDGSPPKRLGEGTASELSADGRWAVVVRPTLPSRLVLVPTGAGEERVLENGRIDEIAPDNVRWSFNGSRLLFGAQERGHGPRYYVQDIAGGRPRPITPEGCVEAGSISPDGRFVIAQCHDDGT
jgi:Tol biopolymer transport system component